MTKQELIKNLNFINKQLNKNLFELNTFNETNFYLNIDNTKIVYNLINDLLERI